MKRNLEMKEQRKPKFGRLVLVVFPYQGHMIPMFQLANILHLKGFSITIAHPEVNSPDPSNHPEFTLLSLPDKLAESNTRLEDFIGTIKALNRNCHEPLLINIKKILEEENPHDVIVGVIYDTCMYCAQSVADHLRIPGFIVRTSAAAAILATSEFHRPNDQQGYISLLETMSNELLPEPLFLKLKDYHDSRGFPKEPILEQRASFTRAMQKSKAIIANTMPFLEEQALSICQQYFPAKLSCIGPFHKLAPNASNSLLNEDRSCITWLDKQCPKSVLYVSFGSVASINEKDLLEMAWGLANSEQPFLWVIRPGLVPGSDPNKLLPESFLERVGEIGCIVQWAPQKEVLAHNSVRGFWTHCGWNSSLESVCEGVTMLCRPFFGDQPLNAMYVCHAWKIGIELEGEFERGNIEKAVRRLMVNKEGEEMMQRAAEFKEKAELCLKEGGSTSESLNYLTKLLSS